MENYSYSEKLKVYVLTKCKDLIEDSMDEILVLASLKGYKIMFNAVGLNSHHGSIYLTQHKGRHFSLYLVCDGDLKLRNLTLFDKSSNSSRMVYEEQVESKFNVLLIKLKTLI